ncbi:MAG: glycosyltransferase family 4 protein [Actinobacteria bacterium]|nr:glycosyltransferase family 4 protein [Actinomycetota bacterium]
MRNVLLLTSVMKRGFGVSVVAREVADRIGAAGWNMSIGCLEYDEFYGDSDVVELRPSPQTIFEYCQENSIEIVVAQTSPYFEVLPALEMWIPTVVFEHGDPTPTLFDHDVAEREQLKVHKLKRVYPKVDEVLTSSYFLRDELSWPDAKVIALGCDHVTDHGNPTTQRSFSDEAPLRVGTLMRLGPGEALYKGLEEYLAIVSDFAGRPGFDFSIMGRGVESDRLWWEERGVHCHLNATDDERSTFLSELDVFISPSKWEGFNLPLVEAHASGTVGLAFDVGAHPETTPYVLPNIADATFLLEEWQRDPALLQLAAERCYIYSRKKFPWESTALELGAHLDGVVASANWGPWRRSRIMKIWRMVVGRYRIDGLTGISKAIVARLRKIAGRLFAKLARS